MRILLTLALVTTIFNLSLSQTCGETLIGTDQSNGGNTLVEFDPATGTSVDLFELNPASNTEYGILVSGEYCYIHTEFNSPSQFFLYCVDITTGIYNPNFPVEVVSDALIQANSCDMTLFGLDRDNDNNVELISIDLTTGTTTTISPNPIPFDIPQGDVSTETTTAVVGNFFYYTATEEQNNTSNEILITLGCIDITTGELVNQFETSGFASFFNDFVLDEASGLLFGIINNGGGAFFASFDPVTGTFTTIGTTSISTDDAFNPTIVGTNYCYSTGSQFICLDLATGDITIDLADVGSTELSAFDTNCTCPGMAAANPIPTASEWGLIILALLLLIFSTYSIRQLSGHDAKQTSKVGL